MANYSGYSFEELLNLPLGAYLLIRKDSWISSMMATEESREVLKRIYELQVTTADYDAIRRLQGYRAEEVDG